MATATPTSRSLLLPLAGSVLGHSLVVLVALSATVLGARCSTHRVLLPDPSIAVSVVQRAETPMTGELEPILPAPVRSGSAIGEKQAFDLEFEGDRQAMLDELERLARVDQLALETQSGVIEEDEEYALYVAAIQQLTRRHFKPLPAISVEHPGIRCVLLVHADMGSGAIVSVEVLQGSGVQAYDESAIAAIDAADRFPLPPPRLRPLFAEGYPLEMRVD